ncbi:tetratricopeptide repeat-containing hybrid sensor histidine kinase/response regulator [Nonlabens antarcticus]|uniref:tetratricopeptide repeat-containing hybrid sensor histidine kinase/response regulator n=1 Tax=Nonlabens antarcticus TaxID=392714 RepID=UPI001890D54A|nr:response regulator [Nonlabens antarcticus]
MNSLQFHANKFGITVLFLMMFCSAFGQKNTNFYNAEEKKLQQELVSLLDTIREKYYGQDFVSAMDLSQKGRELSNTKKFYHYYTYISSNLGNALIQMGDTLQATKIFEESLEKAEIYQKLDVLEKDKQEVLTTSYVDMANILALTGNYEEAILKYKQVLKISSGADLHTLFVTNYNIAESYLELGMPDLAEPYVMKSERLAEKLNFDTYTASSQLLSGKYYLLIKDYQASTPRFEKAVKYAKSENYIEVVIEGYLHWSEAEAQLGNYKKALELSNKLDSLRKEKFSIDRVIAIENAKAEFEVAEAKRISEIVREKALRENTLFWSVIALSISTILIILLLIGFSRRKKLNKDLAEKNLVYLEEKQKSDRLLTARNALFSRISHELRTPMYGIVGISNILIEDKAIREIQKENIRSLKYSADYLLSLINNVLEMNKLNRSSYLSLTQEVFDIRELCDHAVESAKYVSLDHNNVFHIEIDRDVSNKYRGDAVKLMQVLINILGNSNKFTKDGEIVLKINKLRSTGPVDLLAFMMSDTGKGIASGKLNDIFDETKFINHNEEFEGTGLGLAISKKILELQDSNLVIKSELGKGTTVEFKLKLESVRLDLSDMKLIDENVISKDLTGTSILIVEDNKINQLVTKKIIEGFNGNYEIAESGLEAIEMTQKKEYDLILMDINMPPGMDGFAAAREIRKFNVEVPIIALTAVEQIEIEKRMKNSLINDYLIKPFKSEEFLVKISNFLKSHDTDQ